MKEIIGNIWDFHKDENWIIVPTNGDIKKNGEAVMGRGLAKQAAERFPNLPKQLANFLQYGNQVAWLSSLRILTFPTKDHWRNKSSMSLIERSINELLRWNWLSCSYYLPRVGCGNGGLSWEREVRPLLNKYLDDRFTVVDNGSKAS